MSSFWPPYLIGITEISKSLLNISKISLTLVPAKAILFIVLYGRNLEIIL